MFKRGKQNKCSKYSEHISSLLRKAEFNMKLHKMLFQWGLPDLHDEDEYWWYIAATHKALTESTSLF